MAVGGVAFNFDENIYFQSLSEWIESAEVSWIFAQGICVENKRRTDTGPKAGQHSLTHYTYTHHFGLGMLLLMLIILLDYLCYAFETYSFLWALFSSTATGIISGSRSGNEYGKE